MTLTEIKVFPCQDTMKLRQLHIKGFKSIDGDLGQLVPFEDVTVLLGANGSGKSNLLSFIEMSRSLARQELGEFVAKQGVSRLLYYGPQNTDDISFIASFDDGGISRYEVTLKRGLPDGLSVGSERIGFGQYHRVGENVPATLPQDEYGASVLAESYYLPKGQRGESTLADDENETGRLIYDFLSRIRIYQFNDTSETAKIRYRNYVDDAKYLRHDASNLAAFLKMLKDNSAYKKYYNRIVRHIQRVMPQFKDFDFEPIPGNQEHVRLNWKDSFGSGYLFDPHQISDGSLRFMALATLSLQPPDLLPRLIVLDEPELGLHPAAITELGGLVRAAARNTQVILCTQSTRLIDEFDLQNLVIVERDRMRHCSIFKTLNAEQFGDWLARYSLSELWEKNVIGGQP
ncbi:MAG: AAA family ATPase [Deltaproteobacteria bacterium]|nr:AAA family ATPase [Deltaproteobacteria bacterium]